MKIIKAILFTINVVVLVAISGYLWTVSWCWGFGGLIGVGGFVTGYKLSERMNIAPRDHWRNSEYTIFKKKLAYANSIAGGTMVIASFIVMGVAMMAGFNM